MILVPNSNNLVFLKQKKLILSFILGLLIPILFLVFSTLIKADTGAI
ncbi:MAG: hypothetical protein ACI9VM_000132 [Candidatus Azotimanducaceae bacterium]|jgi:hypothetical protein